MSDPKPSAPHGGDLPPPYSADVGGAPTAAPPNMYPHIGFTTPVTAPAGTYPHPINTVRPDSYSHPSGGYPQPHSAAFSQQAGVMLGTPGPVNVIVAAPMGPVPVTMFCTSCSQQVITKVEYRTSWHTHIVAGIICFTTMFFSMCCLGLVPYCMDTCKIAEHHCPNCNAFLGKYERC